MSTNAMIEIAIGLILMYLVLSLICTVVNEIIATLTRLRARTLRAGVTKLIDNAQLLQVFNDHGLISGTEAAIKGKGPSYLSGRTFAAAILDSFDPETSLVGYQEVVDAIGKLPTSNIKDALTAATVDTGESLDKLRTNVATWFDSAMDRVSGVYKRQLQLLSFLVGLAVAITLNADSFTVAKALWSDSALRSEVADVSYQVVGGTDTDEATIGKLRGELATLRNDIRPLPIGWTSSPGRPDSGWTCSVTGWISKILGWLFTAFAIMLGAPFWFDMLSKFVKIRASGDKPARTTTETAKDTAKQTV
jgi:hypothetical protein